MLADLVTSYGDASMREALFDIMRTESKTRPFLHQASYIDADTKLEFLLGQLRRCEERDNDIIDDRVDRRNRWDTILALSKLNDRRAIPHLMDYYRTDGGWVIRCLGYIQDPLAVDILLTVLYGGGQTNRVTLQDCLIGIKHSENPVFGPHLLHWLYLTRKGLMEEDVIRALGATRNPIAVPDLIPLLARDDAYAPHERKPTIADRAAKALTAIGTPEALAAVAAWREQRA
ncbi:MAG: HEAT repeat domain-containing protein [Chloroflexota bacterium]